MIDTDELQAKSDLQAEETDNLLGACQWQRREIQNALDALDDLEEDVTLEREEEQLLGAGA